MSWLLSWQAGWSIDAQFALVVILGTLVTFGFYQFMKTQQNGGRVDEEGYPEGSRVWYAMCRVGDWTHREDKRSWRVMRELMDGPMLGRIKMEKAKDS